MPDKYILHHWVKYGEVEPPPEPRALTGFCFGRAFVSCAWFQDGVIRVIEIVDDVEVHLFVWRPQEEIVTLDMENLWLPRIKCSSLVLEGSFPKLPGRNSLPQTNHSLPKRSPSPIPDRPISVKCYTPH